MNCPGIVVGRTDEPQPHLPMQPVALPAAPALTDEEQEMVEQFRALNAEGRKIARNTIQGLVLSGAYIKNPASGQMQTGIG